MDSIDGQAGPPASRDEPTPKEALAGQEALFEVDEDPKWPARYGLWAYIAALFAPIFVTGQAVAPSIFFAWDEDTFASVANLLAYGAQAAISILAAVGFASVAQTLSKRQFGLRKIKLRQAIKWILVGILIYAWYDVLLTLFLEGGDVVDDFDSGTLGLISFGIILVVFAPISEEFLFRGFIFQAFRNRMGVVLAALVSSLMFGVLHSPYGWPSVLDSILIGIAATLFGIAMCVLIQKTRSLYPGMALHAMHNGTIFVLVLVGA